MLALVASMLAGLGLFFTGLRMVGERLRQMAGRRLRRAVGEFTRNDVLAALWGTVAGAVTQSSAGITFILVSMTSSGLLSIRRALPILAWANVGFSLLVILASLDIHTAIALLLGISGLLVYFEWPERHQGLIGAVFGISLLFFGLAVVQTAAAPLQNEPWVQRALAAAQGSVLLMVGAGAVLALVVQSSTAVSVIAITMAEAGLLGIEQTILVVYGTNVGDSIGTYLLSAKLRGSMRQIALFQSLFNVIGALLFVALFYLETVGGVPLVLALLGKLSSDIDRQGAYAYLIFNVGTALVLCAVMDRYAAWLARISPATTEEDEARLEFLHEHAVDDLESALPLVRREQSRLARRFPAYMEGLRKLMAPLPPAAEDANAAAHRAFSAVAGEVEAIIGELLPSAEAGPSAERLLAAQDVQNLLSDIEENAHAFSLAYCKGLASPAVGALLSRLLEALDLLFLTAAEALDAPDGGDAALLLELTSDRGQQMRKLRESFWQSEGSLAADDRSTLFALTNLFERIVWLENRLATVLTAEISDARAA